MFSSWLGRQESPDEKNRRHAKLLGDATRQFSAIPRPTAGEIDAYKDLFYQLIASCDAASRRLISASLASYAYTPVQIVIFLASDSADVATPVLLFSPVIGETHIVRLAGRLPREHLRVLARRGDLTGNSIKALLENGGAETAEVMRANPALRHHAALFGGRPPAVVPAKTSSKENAAPPQPRQRLEPAPQRRGAEAELLRLAKSGGKAGRRSSSAAVTAFAEPGPTPAIPFGRRLLLASRGRHHETVAALIATEAGASTETIQKFLGAGEIEPLLVFLKGLAVDHVTAMQVALLVRPEIGADREAFARVTHLYRAIEPAECEAVLRLLSKHTPMTAMHADRKPDFAEAARNRRAAIAAMVESSRRPSWRTDESTSRVPAPRDEVSQRA